MNCKEARELLQQVADYTNVPEVARAAEMGVQALEKVERLEAEPTDERYRHDRYADYSVERDRMIDQLKEDLRNSGRNDPCDYCKHNYEPVPCAEDRVEDIVPCWGCERAECICHACRDWNKWEWRGMPEVKHEGN